MPTHSLPLWPLETRLALLSVPDLKKEGLRHLSPPFSIPSLENHSSDSSCCRFTGTRLCPEKDGLTPSSPSHSWLFSKCIGIMAPAQLLYSPRPSSWSDLSSRSSRAMLQHSHSTKHGTTALLPSASVYVGPLRKKEVS